MDHLLLNCLIEADVLAQKKPDAQTLEQYAEQVEQWKATVDAMIAVRAHPLSKLDVAAVRQLMQQSEVIQENLAQFRRVLYSEHQQLIKNNAALTAYMTSTS